MEDINEEPQVNGELVSKKAAEDLLKRAKPALKKLAKEIPDEAQNHSIEWDGIVEEVGLAGVVIRPVNEHMLWATKQMFPNKTRVRVTVEKA